MNYRIDHLAFRTLDKKKCVNFFKEALGYKEQAEFTIYFDDKKKDMALCTAMEPNNRISSATLPWTFLASFGADTQEYILAPEVFISEGTPGSIVHNWASKRDGGGLHHIALQVPGHSSVEREMKKWLDMGWAEEFSSDVIKCDDLCQVFTRPSSLTGVVFELIQRKEHGFCKDSVKFLMESTQGD